MGLSIFMPCWQSAGGEEEGEIDLSSDTAVADGKIFLARRPEGSEEVR